MWTIELRFRSADPEQHAVRLAARPAHRVLLGERHAAGLLVAAGPFADDSGALLLVDVPDRAGAEAFVAGDPYFALPAVEVASVREWTPVVGGVGSALGD